MAQTTIRSGLTRFSRFSFVCNRCLSCCRDKRIQINPYEIARLAANRGMSTTAFIAGHTTAGGTALRFTAEGTCPFLCDRGCGVHPDRPLVCRLYPLGRTVSRDGADTFAQVCLEDGCRGVLSASDSIDVYLDEQGAAPFLRAADLYLRLFWDIVEALDATPAGAAGHVAGVFQDAVAHGSGWFDMDLVIDAHCARNSEPAPRDIEDKTALHLRIVRSMLGRQEDV